MKNSIVIFILFMLLQLACTKKIDLKIKDKADVPVLDFIISNKYDGSDGNFAVLTKSNFILDSDKKFDSISGAQFNFYKGETTFGMMKEFSQAKGSYFLTDNINNQILLASGANYKVTASVPGFPEISAETNIPPLTNFSISDIKYDSIFFDLKLNITDDDPEFNYYLFDMTFNLTNPLDTNQKVTYTNFYIPEEILELRSTAGSSAGFLDLFSDGINSDFIISETDLKNFNNQFTFDSRSYNATEPSFGGNLIFPLKFENFRVYKLSKDLYQYIKSSRKQFEVGDNPFSEPAFVYSNVKNGLGIFAGYSVTSYK